MLRSFKQSTQTARRLSRSVDVMRCRDRDVSVTQEILRSGQAVFSVHHRAAFFSQLVNRFLRADAFSSQPRAETLENVLSTVILERRAFARQIARLDHETRTRFCSITAHDRHQLGIHWNVADRVLSLNVKMFCRLDSNDV